MKSFVFIYTGGIEEREKLVEVLNKIPEVYSWRYDTAVCFYILSNSTGRFLAEAIKNHYPNIGRYMITKLGDEYWGDLTGGSWHMLEKREVPPQSNE